MSQKTQKGVNPEVGDENRTRKRYQTKHRGAEKHAKSSSSDVCKDCDSQIESDTKALSCNFCHKWVCTDCLEISDDLYQVLTQNPKSPLLVPCKDCSGQIASLSEMRNTLNEVKLNQNGTMKQLDELNKKVGAMNRDLQKTVKEAVRKEVGVQLDARLVQVESKLEVQIDNKIEAVRDNMVSAGEMSHDKIKDVVREAYKEERQRELRKVNLMLFNVPEVTTRYPHVRKGHDWDSVLKVLKVLNDMEDIESKVLKVMRIGRRIDEKTRRPIKIVFPDWDTKFKFLQNSYRLSESDDDMVKLVRVTNDRTPNEIKQYKELKKELDERISAGERNLKIRRGAIVQINSVGDVQEVSEGAGATSVLENERVILGPHVREASQGLKAAVDSGFERVMEGPVLREEEDVQMDQNFRFSPSGLERYVSIGPKPIETVIEVGQADSVTHMNQSV